MRHECECPWGRLCLAKKIVIMSAHHGDDCVDGLQSTARMTHLHCRSHAADIIEEGERHLWMGCEGIHNVDNPGICAF